MNQLLKRMIKGVVYLIGGFTLLLLIFIALNFRSEISVGDLEPVYFTAESSYMNVDDARIHMRRRGSGPVLFLLHGSFASLHTWQGWEDELSQSFTTISLDFPGHGLTGPNQREDYSTDYYADLVISLADTLKIDTFYVAGNSMGGNVAWKMALRHPDRVRKLVLIDAAGYKKAPGDSSTKGMQRPLIFRMLNNRLLATLFTRVTPRFLFKRNLREVYGDPEKFTDQIIDRYYLLTRRDGNRDATLKRLWNSGKDIQDSIRYVKTPTLIIWGEEDRWIPITQAHYFHKALNNSKLIIFPGVGHVPMEEFPKATADSAAVFLLKN